MQSANIIYVSSLFSRSIKDVITEEDIETWAGAVVRAPLKIRMNSCSWRFLEIL